MPTERPTLRGEFGVCRQRVASKDLSTVWVAGPRKAARREWTETHLASLDYANQDYPQESVLGDLRRETSP